MIVHINSEADSDLVSGDILKLAGLAGKHEMTFGKGQLYHLQQGQGEPLELVS